MSEWIKRLAERYSEVNEKKLTGNQHKLDMDKDGDIDAADFAHMRKKKKANEEEEVVMNPKKEKKDSKETMAAEAKLDELSPALLKRYTKKADKDAVKSFNKATDHEDDDDSTKHDKLFDRGMKRADGATKAREKLVAKGHKAPKYPNESVEQTDEGVMDKVHNIRRKVFGKSDAEKRAEAERNAMAGFHNAMKKAADGMTKKRKPATESTLPPVYSRIMEARGTADKDGKHSKKAAPPEDWNEKEKNNKGAMDMKKDMAVNTSDKISNYDDLGHDDASKAGRATNAAKTRPGDNAAGDKKIVNPVKGATS